MATDDRPRREDPPQPDSPLREYDVVFDLVEHTKFVSGATDFYGVPTPNGRVEPAMIAERVHPDDVETFMEALQEMTWLRAGESFSFEMRMRHELHGFVRSRYTVKPATRGPNGKVSRVLMRVTWLAFESG